MNLSGDRYLAATKGRCREASAFFLFPQIPYSFSFCFARKMSFLKRTKRVVLFFRRKRKELKESITYPRPSLKGGMQPLLLVALSLRYARGIKAPAWIQRLRVASRLAIYGSPRRGTGFASHTKTLMKEVVLRNQLKPLCRGLGVAIFFGSFSSVVRRNEQITSF